MDLEEAHNDLNKVIKVCDDNNVWVANYRRVFTAVSTRLSKLMRGEAVAIGMPTPPKDKKKKAVQK
jgi:hypothetical protein